ncbi:unnamed protein product, partial [Mesorhabditis belari]|uniref:Uncharacterized protein n=1 Tax=Mesorhabditis belari TaxID=2138241 RepID=A0AAF3ER01_9BILA
MLSICFMLFFGLVFSEQIRIDLTEIDASYAVDGTKFDNMTSLFILTPTGNDRIVVQAYFEEQNETDFTLWDGIFTYSSKDLGKETWFGPNLSIDMDKNTNFRWALVFCRITQKTEALFNATQRDLFYLDEIVSYTVSVNPENYTYFVTFVHTLGYEYAQLTILPYIDDSTPDCQMTLYSYGNSENHDSSLVNFVDSAVLSFVATVEVPPGCSGSIWATTLREFNFNTVSLEEVPIHQGFVMSQGYPRANDLEKERPIEITYKVDDLFERREETQFVVDLVKMEKSGFLEINIGKDDHINVTTLTTSLGFEGQGAEMELLYKTENNGSFLLRFESRTPIEPKESTMATVTPKTTGETTTTTSKPTRSPFSLRTLGTFTFPPITRHTSE